MDSKPATAGKLLIPTLMIKRALRAAGRFHGYSLCCGPLRAPEGQNGASGSSRSSIRHRAAFLGEVGMRAQFRRGGSSGRGAEADNPHVTTVEPEVLAPAGQSLGRAYAGSARPARRHLPDRCDPALEFPRWPPAFVNTLNVIAWIVWACFCGTTSHGCDCLSGRPGSSGPTS